MAKLSLNKIRKDYGDRTIINDLNLEVESGKMVCLLGPSGSGKTTILRMIGGFIRPDGGEIEIDNQDYSQVSPDRRPTSMVFQQYALWPHMTVFKNIAFGLKMRQMNRKEIAEQVSSILSLVDLSGYEYYYPAQLSGGQQQRVALARALVLKPKVLLLDEPLSNLDAQLRVKVREEIREIQRRANITTVFVTHDQDEALSVSDKVAVLSEGRIEQFDTPNNLYGLPKTRFVATFIGSINLLEGTVQQGKFTSPRGVSVPIDEPIADVADASEIAVRPEDILLNQGEGASAQVIRRIPRGHYAEVLLNTPLGELRAFVSNYTTLSDSVSFRFQRVLVYRGGQLVIS